VTLGGNKQSIDSFNSNPNPDGTADPDRKQYLRDYLDRIYSGMTDAEITSLLDRYAAMSIVDIYNEQNSLAGNTQFGHDFVNDRASVASPSTNILDISVGNTNIYGLLATGAAEEGYSLTQVIGPNGHLYDSESATKVDLGNIAYDFYAELPMPEAPNYGTLPAPVNAHPHAVIGAEETNTFLHASAFTIANNFTKNLQGNVTMVVDGNLEVKGSMILEPGEHVFVVNGNFSIDGEVLMQPGASLTLYMNGDLSVKGTGLVNSGTPKDLLIYGTKSGTKFDLQGNGFLSAAIYAPYTDLNMRGGGNTGEFYGAAVGDRITISGNNYDIRYDEALADLDMDWAPQVTQWVELTRPEIQTYGLTKYLP